MTESSERVVADQEAVNPADVRLAAMNLLARREHSLKELRRKLLRRFDDPEIVDFQVRRLADDNLQCDKRFAESFVRQGIFKGHGPARVRQDLRQRGITDTECDSAIEVCEVDWTALAEAVFAKKFGAKAPGDAKEKARRIRFMQYRGFFQDHFQHLLI
ncbi:MAG: regulatory protein RecX [Halioglobus sp.]